MILIRHLLLIAVAALLSWLVLLRSDVEPSSVPELEATAMAAAELKLAVRPRIEQLEEDAAEPPAVQPSVEEAVEPAAEPTDEPERPEPTPPAPERGAPDGAEDGELPPPAIHEPAKEVAPALAQAPEEPTDSELQEKPAGPPRSRFMEDENLLAEAQRELTGETRVGFETQILSAPEDQLEIARSFGGEIVLVPRAAIDPSKDPAQAVWFRLRPSELASELASESAGESASQAQVERVVGPPELSNWTRYRDLFDYEYQRLPKAVRDLRRSVLSRAEVFLFAGLISNREWALVVGRRTEALKKAGRRPEELRRATLRTIRTADGFDFRVESLEYATPSSTTGSQN